MGSGRRGVSICFATSSLIGVGGVKLNLSTCSLDWRLVRVGHTLLFAVGARPPHNGVRKARRLNLFRDFFSDWGRWSQAEPVDVLVGLASRPRGSHASLRGRCEAAA